MPSRPLAGLSAVVAGAIAILTWLEPTNAIAQQRTGPFDAQPRSVRTREFDLEHLRLELKFDWDRRRVDAYAVQTVVPFAATNRLELDAVDLRIERITLLPGTASSDGTSSHELKYETHDDKLVITLDHDYAANEPLTVAIDYHVSDPKRGVHFVVPDENEPEQPRIVWTQNQPEDARYWIPCFDSPNERATSELSATVPENYFVLSNGDLKSTQYNQDGTKTWHWTQKQPHTPYLISVVAGEFEAYEQSYGGVPIVSYVPCGRLDDAERAFGQTPEMMQLFADLIGCRYPWSKYAQICCDEYGGGMEHTSATTLGLGTLHDEKAALDVSAENLVAHELAHQWWGDLLTCKDWAELWLNESFATYFANLWREHDEGSDEAVWERQEEADAYFAEDKRYRRPIVSYRYREPGNMFDRHTYEKGGRVLHMLRYVLGDEAYFKALGHYCRKHAYDVVETADLRSAIEESTGQGINWFFDQWLYHGGHPEYEVSYTWDDDEKLVHLKVRQTQKIDDVTPLFRMTVDIDLTTSKGTVRKRITVSKAEEMFSLELDERPTRICFDGEDWILKKLDFKKSKEEWLDQLANDSHVMCRVRAAEQLGTMRTDDAARAALLAAASDDSFWAVRKEVTKAVAKFGGDDVRAVLLEIARSDDKSAVRREAIEALADFPHQDTTATLCEVIDNDSSYYAVAEALKTLAKVAPGDAQERLIAALERSSHREVILKAACDGLAELGNPETLDRLRKLLEPPAPHERRAAVLVALAKMGQGNDEIAELLLEQLDDTRRTVRQRAIEALAESGDLAAAAPLLERRAGETSPRMLAAIDDAVAKLRDNNDVTKLRQQVESLEKENKRLDERLKKLEEAVTD